MSDHTGNNAYCLYEWFDTAYWRAIAVNKLWGQRLCGDHDEHGNFI